MNLLWTCSNIVCSCVYFGSEMVSCFNNISVDSKCRSVVFSGAGKIFSAGCIFFAWHIAGTILVGFSNYDHRFQLHGLEQWLSTL